MVLNGKEIETGMVSKKVIEKIDKEGVVENLIDTNSEEIKVRGKEGYWLKEVEKINSGTETMVVKENSLEIIPTDKIKKDSYAIPLTKSQFIANTKKKKEKKGKNVKDGWLWLITFFFRVIKLKKGNVSFKENGSN
jgi:cell division protein YceG involved in septum cleavage